MLQCRLVLVLLESREVTPEKLLTLKILIFNVYTRARLV